MASERSWWCKLYGCSLVVVCILLLAGVAYAQFRIGDFSDEVVWEAARSSRNTAVGDYDNDGWPDLITGGGRAFLIMKNDRGRHFFARDGVLPLDSFPQNFGAGVSFVDYDNDLDLDLFVPIGQSGTFEQGNTDERAPNMLFRNDGGTYREVAAEIGLTAVQPSDGAIWLDGDRDGYLDLYVINLYRVGPDSTVRNRYFRNLRNGHFADATQAVGLHIELDSKYNGSGFSAVAGDFDDDGWPDLYMGVFNGRNRLFLNDGTGHFVDATRGDIGDPGDVGGAAVGDIDNDGDLDLFQATSSTSERPIFRPIMLLNRGGGEFLDVTEGVGLRTAEESQGSLPSLVDLDNDGDLDLSAFTESGRPHLVFLNNGRGNFTKYLLPDGININGGAIADYDANGFLDFLSNKVFRIEDNGNHWLAVELVGTESNRHGVGARLVATAGKLSQTRELYGSTGFTHSGFIAHFGLREHEVVDQLEVRWPSGKIDLVENIAANQRIRVFEGSTVFHPIRPIEWLGSDSLAMGPKVPFAAAVRPALFAPGAAITRVVADLSGLGGDAALPLSSAGDGIYRGQATLPLNANGRYQVLVSIEQNTPYGPYLSQLWRPIIVVPKSNLSVMDEGLAMDWQLETPSGVNEVNLQHRDGAYNGDQAASFVVERRFAGWTITMKAPMPFEPTGYDTLRFAFRPGELDIASNSRFTMGPSPGKPINLLTAPWVDLERREWQQVAIPMSEFLARDLVASITFGGNFGGTFFIDDLTLVAVRAKPEPTAVLEQWVDIVPESFALSQNFPNPFNSDTMIHFSLPEAGAVELSVYNLAGQQVATLVKGLRQVGNYVINWDGRDDRGRVLATGVYMYRLQVGGTTETRKMTLLR